MPSRISTTNVGTAKNAVGNRVMPSANNNKWEWMNVLGFKFLS